MHWSKHTVPGGSERDVCRQDHVDESQNGAHHTFCLFRRSGSKVGILFSLVLSMELKCNKLSEGLTVEMWMASYCTLGMLVSCVLNFSDPCLLVYLYKFCDRMKRLHERRLALR